MKSKFFVKKIVFLVGTIFIVLVIGLALFNHFVLGEARKETPTVAGEISVNEETELEKKLTKEGFAYYVLDNPEKEEKFVTIVKYNGKEQDVIVPSEIDGYEVKWIDTSCFTNSKKIVSIKIPETVVRIGNNVFCGCPNLEKVIIPSSVTKIGFYVFLDSEEVTVYGQEKTLAEKYAKEQNVKFEQLN